MSGRTSPDIPWMLLHHGRFPNERAAIEGRSRRRRTQRVDGVPWALKRLDSNMGTIESALPADPAIPSNGKSFERTIQIAIAAYLLFLGWWIVSIFATSLLLPWYSSSDETVIAGEVIRFSELDFHQRFYDMPGTPLMLFGAAQWRLFYAWSGLFHGFNDGINVFSFQNLQQLLMMLRIDNIVFFLLSGLLLFRIVSRFSDQYAGAAAATVLLMNPAYAMTAGFLRVESLAICLMLAGVLVLTESESKASSFWAGLLGGLAVACRLHGITAALPILGLILFRQTWGLRRDYSKRCRNLLLSIAAIVFVGAGLLFYYFGPAPSAMKADFPLAYGLLAKAAALICLSIVAAVLLYLLPGTRSMIVNTIHFQFLALLGGVVLGFVLGTPTVFTQYKALLTSLNFYLGPAYKDLAAMHLSFWDKVVSYVTYYGKTIAPNNVALALLILGVGLVLLLPRWRTLWPFVIVALGFFFSKPLDLRRAEHHVALWIPFFAILSAVPIAAAARAFVSRGKVWRYSIAPAAILALLLLHADLRSGPVAHASGASGHRERLHNIEGAREWIQGNTPKDSSFWIAFYCFGPEVFYSWFRDWGLKVPASLNDGREYLIWWGKQSELKGQSGFACLTPTDVTYMKEFESRQPGEGIDPLHDSRFHVIHSFGTGPNEIYLTQFDLADAGDVRPTGFTFSMHSALRLDSLTLAYDKASIRGKSPSVVTTGPELWSFAASIPIIVPHAPGAKEWLHVRGRVLKGRIGIGIHDRTKDLIQSEEFLSPSANTKDIYISLPAGFPADDLMVRNVRAGTLSEIALEETEVLARAHSANPVARLQEIQVAYDRASIIREPRVKVTTASQQWSFAAVIPIHGSVSVPGLVVRIRARVLQGRIGFAILSPDGKTIQREQYYDKSQNPVEVFLPVELSGGVSKLLIRNAAAEAMVSIAELDAIETWQLE
jgi:hypothetical protein